MHLTSTYVEPKTPPALMDNLMAARFTSFFTLLAGLWFWGLPILIWGLSDEPLAWNSWLAGGLVITFACIRLVWPRYTTLASWANAVLGVWILLSPFLFGYSGNLILFFDTIGPGLIILGYSLFSSSFTRRLPASL